MVAGRCARPFSLEQKLAQQANSLERHLPPHRKPVEIRLLALKPAWRNTTAFAGLIALIARHFKAQGCDLAVISGTVRQLKLYRHLGFQTFAEPIGTPAALYQPMFLTLAALERVTALQGAPAPARAAAPVASRAAAPVTPRVTAPVAPGDAAPEPQCFLPGPVAIAPDVRDALQGAPASHRASEFIARMARVRRALCHLTGAPHATLLIGTGTLANDAVAAQLQHSAGPGLILANGEFGERLIDHAVRWRLPFTSVYEAWGQPFDAEHLRDVAHRRRPRWIWAVLSETSTGVLNSLAELKALSVSIGADLCLDAVSAIGLQPVELAGVRFATAVSGKGLAAYPGLAVVLHDGRLAPLGSVPGCLDLAAYEAADGVPYTHSSNLVAALECALQTDWPEKFQRVARACAGLRAGLRTVGLEPLAADAVAMPGIVTVPLPLGADAAAVGYALRRQAIEVAFESRYLRRRNWLQICLMGQFDAAALARLPQALSDAMSMTKR
jgi:aspartate aminotransferase-like enzyme